MAQFRNDSRKSISIIFNGRKILIKPNQIISGPEHFKMYTGLTRLDGSNEKPKKHNIDPDLSRMNPKVKKKPKVVRKIIRNENAINMVDIPNHAMHLTNQENIELEVNKTLQFLQDYPKDSLPSVAICILSKNSLELIKDCCDSIIKEVHYPNTKVYIFDTGTTDSSVIDYYQQLKMNQNIKFEVLQVGEFNFSKNYNFGISQINEDYVLIQNNDTKALNDYISKLMKLVVVQKVGMVGPRMFYADGRIQHDGQHLFDPTGTKFVNPGHVNLGQPNTTPGGTHMVDGITAAGVLMKRSWFLELGGFKESFRDIYQDVHLSMKNRMMGKIAVCDRDAHINHYDNTSRKHLWNDRNKVLDMNRDHNNLFNMIRIGEIKINKRSTKDIALITLVNNYDVYADFLDDIKKQKTNKSIEIIAIPNFNNEFSSAAEALNLGKTLSESVYNIFCHQDLRVEEDWIEKIIEGITHLDSTNPNWGVLGMAGATYDIENNGHQHAATYLLNSDSDIPGEEALHHKSKREHGDVKYVQCLDEMCLITKAVDPIRFDENIFNHYHFYGADFCLQYIHNGKTNYAINAPCKHLSDGFGNLLKEEHRNKFTDAAVRLCVKWKGKIPSFRTMTSLFDTTKSTIFFYVGERLRKEGIRFNDFWKIK